MRGRKLTIIASHIVKHGDILPTVEALKECRGTTAKKLFISSHLNEAQRAALDRDLVNKRLRPIFYGVSRGASMHWPDGQVWTLRFA